MSMDDIHCINAVQVFDWALLPFSIDFLTCSHKQSNNSLSTKVKGVFELHGEKTEILWECPDKLKITGTLTIHCMESTDSISVIINDQPVSSISNTASRSFTISHFKKVEIKGFTPSTFSSGKYELTLNIQASPDQNGNPTTLTCQATLPSNSDHTTKKASIIIRGFVTVNTQNDSLFTFPIHYKTHLNMYAPKGALIQANLSSIQVTPTIIPSSPKEELSYLYVKVTGKIDVETLKKTNISLKGTDPPSY
ncbi:S-Ena type endospore appendage [Sutcliffiella deserti]|uniref:S-Ena type endospore appendage n=1 Tax=Sutcliffiella deserti TaxID=2875501 RepID=UPI001CC13119|nr:S-Ena type endospore appendage [Sutcliffiella deserti]